MQNPAAIGEGKRRGPRYTPLSKRQDRPAAIAWLVKFHPELSDAQISKLIGTTKPTIQSIRARTHWNIANFQPIDPVALGLCKQTELDALITIRRNKKSEENSIKEQSKNEESKMTNDLMENDEISIQNINELSNNIDQSKEEIDNQIDSMYKSIANKGSNDEKEYSKDKSDISNITFDHSIEKSNSVNKERRNSFKMKISD
jgi:hypothetical protein